MNDDKEQPKQNERASDQQKQESLHVKNPFKPGEETDISQEQLDKEQEYKEALTERD